MVAQPEYLIHPLAVRITHWINVFAMLIMIFSGWRIYNASPLFDFKFPGDLTLGGWLGGALQWHFAAMWLLAAERARLYRVWRYCRPFQIEFSAVDAANGMGRIQERIARPDFA